MTIRKGDWIALFVSALFSCVALLGLLLLLSSCGGDAFTTELEGHLGSADGGGAGSGGMAGAGGASAGAGGALAGSGGTSAGSGGAGGLAGEPCPGMPGVRLPPGTIASASSFVDSSRAPVLAIDCNFETAWAAAEPTGSLTFSFPSPVHIAGVAIAGASSPEGASTFAIYAASADGAAMLSIGTAVRPTTGGVTTLETIAVVPGSYTSLRIDVTPPAPSWAAIADVTVIP